jgi:predicted GIY-YIG superfamily endonuclease
MYIKWTEEKCREEALKYNCISYFKKGSSSAFAASKRYNYINDITKHMLKPHEISIKWTYEKCKEEALKYKYKSEFRKNCSRAYNISLKNKWIMEICAHMLAYGDRFNRCIYAYEFEDNCVYIGLTYNLLKRNKSHLNDNNSNVYKHMNEFNLKPKLIQMTDYIPVKKAVFLENEYINIYVKNGWTILNIAKAGSTGSNVIKWTKEKCHNEALKYDNIRSFFNNSKYAYKKALKYKWLDEICSHMLIKKLFKCDWTKENCHNEALKCNYKFEFSKKCAAAYKFARRQGWLDEICLHMIKNSRSKNYWNKERCLEVSKNCKNKKQFQKKYYGAYSSSRKNNWLNEFFEKNIYI